MLLGPTPPRASSSTKPAPKAAPKAKPQPQSRPTAAGYAPPATINDTCATDDTLALESWLISLPTGSHAKPTTVQFAKGGCYLVNGELYLRGLTSTVFDGNGATFKQATPRTCRIRGLGCADRAKVSETDIPDDPATAPYCGSTAFMNSSRSEDTAVDVMWWFEGGCDITLEDMTIEGTNDGSGGRMRQQDSFVDFAGTQRALVEDVTMSGPYGDYVDCAGLHEAGLGGNNEATDITIAHDTLSRAGRVGIGIIACSRVSVTDNVISGGALCLFDIEEDNTTPLDGYGPQDDISITHNTIPNMGYTYLLSAQTAGGVNRLAFDDNTLTGTSQFRVVVKAWSDSGNIEIDGNTVAAPTTWPHSRGAEVVVEATHGASLEDVQVDDNKAPLFEWKTGDVAGAPFADFDDAADWAAHNTFTADRYLRSSHYAGSVYVMQSGSPGIACGNTTSAGVSLDRACSKTPPAVTAPTLALLPDN